MFDIRKIFSKKKKWEASMVRCDICTYEWVAVRPFGTPKLECPNCRNITNFENILTDEY